MRQTATAKVEWLVSESCAETSPSETFSTAADHCLGYGKVKQNQMLILLSLAAGGDDLCN
jgi:hypothetical protein